MRLRTLLVIGSTAFLPTMGPAQVLRVPSQHKTIVAALAAAKQGSTILVAAGTYKERLSWPAVDGIRLVSEGGPLRTTIDAEKKGRVLTFSSSLSRKTLVEGFTITNGLLQTSRNHGAGIYMSRSSPTLRGNRITANVGDGTSWNYGGGVYIDGGAPLIVGNTIEGNELRNGSWNYGAGIYVGSSAKPLIVGNRIVGNRNSRGSRGYGGGIFVTSASGTVIASNLIVGNLCQSGSWNYGAGVRLYSSGAAVVVNNTIVENRCVGGNWAYGGGIQADSRSGAVVLAGNIVVRNTARQGGGLHRGSSFAATLTLDWNDVWMNTGGNYSGFKAGANDISKDPGFVSTTDFHLTKASPCVDAMPATHLPSTVALDLDSSPRRADGNLDGLAGNGARLDMGADEFSGVLLAATALPKLGTQLQLTVTAKNRSIYLLLLDLTTGPGFVVEPYGNLLLGLGLVPIGGGVTPGTLPWGLPNDPVLAGITTYQQAVVLPVTSRDRGQLTNLLSLTMF